MLWIEQNELLVRLSIFAVVLVSMVSLEVALPRRVQLLSRWRRWLTNLAIAASGAAVLRVMAVAAVPLAATWTAHWANANGVGLLNLTALPGFLEVAIALAVLDLAIWAQHLASHHVGFLWRIHRVHHADRDFDATTALRFHPIEIGLSMLFKMAIVLALGPSVAAVIVFEIALNGLALFNHANLRIPTSIDAVLRLVLITPDVHRVHHSIHSDEHNCNFGFSISWWDRLFGTFRAQPRAGHDGMTIGLPSYQNERPARLGWSLALPFREPPAALEVADREEQ